MRKFICVFYLVFLATGSVFGQDFMKVVKDGKAFYMPLKDTIDVFKGEIYPISSTGVDISKTDSAVFKINSDSTSNRLVGQLFVERIDVVEITNNDSLEILKIYDGKKYKDSIASNSSKVFLEKDFRDLRIQQRGVVFLSDLREKLKEKNEKQVKGNKTADILTNNTKEEDSFDIYTLAAIALFFLAAILSLILIREKKKTDKLNNENSHLKFRLDAANSKNEKLAAAASVATKPKTKNQKIKVKPKAQTPPPPTGPIQKQEITSVELRNHNGITFGISELKKTIGETEEKIQKNVEQDAFLRNFLPLIKAMFEKNEEKKNNFDYGKWEKILDGLKQDNRLTEPGYVKAVRDFREEKEQMKYLEKPMYIEYLQPTIESIFILTEELHKLKYFAGEGKTENFSKFAQWEDFIKSQTAHLRKILKTHLDLEVNTVEILKPLTDYAEFTEATDQKEHRLYYEKINELAKQQEQITVVEILGLSTTSPYENSKTLVTVAQ